MGLPLTQFASYSFLDQSDRLFAKYQLFLRNEICGIRSVFVYSCTWFLANRANESSIVLTSARLEIDC